MQHSSAVSQDQQTNTATCRPPWLHSFLFVESQKPRDVSVMPDTDATFENNGLSFPSKLHKTAKRKKLLLLLERSNRPIGSCSAATTTEEIRLFLFGSLRGADHSPLWRVAAIVAADETNTTPRVKPRLPHIPFLLFTDPCTSSQGRK